MQSPASTPQPPSVAIVGAGPRGIEVLERLAASRTELLGDLGLVVHVIDPYPPGGGKVWRFDQSPLLRLNSMATDVTLFTDDTVRCDGPIEPGPTLAEWAASVDPGELPTDDLRAEAAATRPIAFPTRRLGGEYLAWAYRRAVQRLGDDVGTVSVVEHPTSVIDICADASGSQLLMLADGTTLTVDAVVLTLGHLDAEPSGEAAALAAFAARHGLSYLPPSYGTEADLSMFGAGQDVIVRGFGLGFVDLLVLLTEGRGGHYVQLDNGRLLYEASGAEPRLYIGSRRGVPYRTKITYESPAPRPSLPRFLDRTSIAAMIAEHDVVDFRAHAWPLIAKELAWAGYHELAHAHPERVTRSWAAIDSRLASVDWGTAEWDEAVAWFVPDVVDRIDFDDLDRPLSGMWFDDAAALQAHLRGAIRADITRRADPQFSADLGVFDAFLGVFLQLPYILGSPKMSAKSRMQDFEDWWFGFFSYYASGPPPQRMQELLALSEAGVITFLGEQTWVRVDDDDAVFIGGSITSPTTVTARALIDARLPGPSVQGTLSPLLRKLATAGDISELILVEPDGSRVSTGQIRVSPVGQQIIDAAGTASPRRFALGAHSTSKAPAFARPRTNALALRHNDACARAVLGVLRDIHLPPSQGDPS